MKKYVIVLSLIVFLFNACKKPKCCCTNFSIGIDLQLTDSSKNGTIDTGFLKTNNDLQYFQSTDSIISFGLMANIDSTEDDMKRITTNLLKISASDTDTILTEITGTCGRSISKIWYNGVLKFPNSMYNNIIVITK
jgi:hypothetical protein